MREYKEINYVDNTVNAIGDPLASFRTMFSRFVRGDFACGQRTLGIGQARDMRLGSFAHEKR